MTNNYGVLQDKLKLIFWPYLRLTIVFLLAYGAVDLALLTWAPGFEPPEEVRKLGLPLLLAAVLLLVALWPRLRLLQGADEQRDLRWLLAVLAVGVMGCGASCLHGYLVASRSSLTVLASPAAVDVSKPLQRYYQFRNVFVTSRYGGGAVRSHTSDKGRKLNFELYISTPLLASAADTMRRVPVWLGVRYTDDISTSASETEKQQAYQAFIQRSEKLFQAETFENPLGYYTRLPNTNERDAYVEAARRTGHCPADSTQALLVLQPGEEAFAKRGGSSATWLLGWVLGGSSLFLILLLIPPLNTSELLAFQSGPRRSLNWPEWLRPRQGYWLTPLLLVSNVAVYLAMALSTQSGIDSFANQDLLAWGANYGPAVAEGAYWRLLSSVFLHGGALHVANNMVILWLLGELLEKPVGTARLALIYLLTGLGSSLASLAWHTETVSVGASGAIFGLMGATLVLAWRRALPADLRGTVVVLVAVTGGLNLLFGFILPGVDNAAHLGGLVLGAILGLALSPGLLRQLPHYEKSEEAQY